MEKAVRKDGEIKQAAPKIPRDTTNAKKMCQDAQPKDADSYLKDADVPGLVLRITPAGGKTWQLRYRSQVGSEWKHRRAGLGSFPAVTVTQARTQALALKAEVSKGADPTLEKRQRAEQRAAEEIEQKLAEARRITITNLFERWAKTDLIRRKDKGAEARRMMTKDVLPFIGEMAVEDVKKPHITEITDTLLGRGTTRMAKVIFALVRQMFRFAVDRGIIEADPTATIKKTSIGGKDVLRSRVLTDPEIRQLAVKVPAARLLKTTELAIWITAATCCRIGELLKARWEHIDLDACTWNIPAENSKNGNKHTVYLSQFAARQFNELKTINGSSEWCYPDNKGKTHISPKTVTKQVGDRQKAADESPLSNRTKLIEALRLPDGKWTPHDLRRTGATNMVRFGVLPEVAERCLNHTEENKVKRTYQHHSYEKEMREAWRLLGERLELLTSPEASNVLLLPSLAGALAQG